MSRSIRDGYIAFIFDISSLAAAAYPVPCIGLTVKAFPVSFVVLYINRIEFAVFKSSGFRE